jgi:hypothetical protein
MSEPGAIRDVLLWHVHGAWTQALVAGGHRYLIPLTDDGGPDGKGLAGRSWPNAREVPVAQLGELNVDLVVLQRPEEWNLVSEWLGREPGSDVPAVYVEHNAPRPHAELSRHPLADQSAVPIVHVTDFNCLMWDNGVAPTRVITHGIADPGGLYSGEVLSAATMINEPLRRWRTVGADLLEPLSAHGPIDVWGIGTEQLNAESPCGHRVTGRGDVPAPDLWAKVARRRVYVHTARWTSLGLSLLEAMFLGMPIVSVAATMTPLVVPGEAGVVSADVTTLGHALQCFLTDHGAALAAGKAAREYALAHFNIERFLADWDGLIDEMCA